MKKFNDKDRHHLAEIRVYLFLFSAIVLFHAFTAAERPPANQTLWLCYSFRARLDDTFLPVNIFEPCLHQLHIAPG